MPTLPASNTLPTAQNELSNQFTYIGIDFGTSTTVVSRAGSAQDSISVAPLPIIQRDQSGAETKGYKVPTCIAYSSRYGELYIGSGAYEARFDGKVTLGKNVWFEFKTLLGEDVGATLYTKCAGR